MVRQQKCFCNLFFKDLLYGDMDAMKNSLLLLLLVIMLLLLFSLVAVGRVLIWRHYRRCWSVCVTRTGRSRRRRNSALSSPGSNMSGRQLARGRNHLSRYTASIHFLYLDILAFEFFPFSLLCISLFLLLLNAKKIWDDNII